MPAPSYGKHWPLLAKQWDSMAIDPRRQHEFEEVAKKLLSPTAKTQYQELEASTGVPWWMIAIIAERESGADFRKSLAQGDPWNRRSVNEPSGRGPFTSWQKAGYDALVTLKGWDRVQDWRLEKVLHYLELYNGWGYWFHGVPSAYVWSGTNIYRSGKYIHDGAPGWRPNVVDVQLGCAPLLATMHSMDPSIQLIRED